MNEVKFMYKKNKLQKLIATILVFALVIGCFAAMPLKTNADGNGPVVTTSLKGNVVTITVIDGSQTYTGFGTYVKNGGQTVDVDGYIVVLEYNGSGVKSAKVTSVPVVVSPAPTPVASTNSGSKPVPVEGIREITKYVWAKGELEALVKRYAGAPKYVPNSNIFTYGYGDYFVRNDLRSNASGDKIPSNAHSADFPGLYFYWDDKQKDDGVLLVDQAVFDYFVDGVFYLTAKNSNTYWSYPITADEAQLVDGYEFLYAFNIPKNFMYTNGKSLVKEDLKNINMVFIDGKYKSAYFDLAKKWYDEEGNLITCVKDVDALNAKLKFNGYKLGVNEVKITDYATAMNGKKVTVTETLPTGWFEKDGKVSQQITVKWNDHPMKVVTFNNQKDYAYITIEKTWMHSDDCACGGFDPVASFITNFGVTTEVVKYPVIEGTYTISEVGHKGWTLKGITGVNAVVDGVATINVVAGGRYTVTFINEEQKKDDRISIEYSFDKTVNGQLFAEWLLLVSENFSDEEIAEIIGGVSFDLFFVESDGKWTVVKEDVPIMGSTVDFGLLVDILEGQYVVVEKLSGRAALVFEQKAPVYITITKNGIPSLGAFFDYNAYYTLWNGYNDAYLRKLNYPGLDQEGNIFRIHVDDINTGVQYWSFCAHAGSDAFAGHNGLCTYYKVADSALNDGVVEGDVPIKDFLAAYNYIIDKYGDLEENRVIAQVVTWVLLGAIKIDSVAFENANLTSEERAAVVDVIENYKGCDTSGKVVDLVYMVCEIADHNFDHCQPQLVPIYTYPFDNTPHTQTFSFSFKKMVGELPIAGWLQTEDILAKLKGVDHMLTDEQIASIIGDISFELWSVDSEGNPVAPVATGVIINEEGIVDFGSVPAGTYIIRETITPNTPASRIFVTPDDVTITVTKDGVIRIDNEEFLSIFRTTFDLSAQYTIINCVNWYDREFTIPQRTLGYPNLNRGGDLFYIGVTNVVTGVEYDSFCAHGGSVAFAGQSGLGCSGYMVAGNSMSGAFTIDDKDVDIEVFLAALNYINDVYGDLSANRAITQTVIWALLGDIDVESTAFEATNLLDEEKDAVKAAVKAGIDRDMGNGDIVDLVYLVCEHDHDLRSCQPQLVPIYERVFVNWANI
jgi:hypothetical protein